MYAELGFAELGGYLTARHGAGWTVNKISRELGCARETVADLLAEVALRTCGLRAWGGGSELARRPRGLPAGRH